jgi:hypothetical protein
MRTENKKRWMILAIVILAAMNVAMVVTVLYNRHRVAEVLNVQQNRENEIVNPSIRFSGRYFRDQLGLSRAQMSDFSRFNPEFRQRAREINIRLAELRQQMLNELSADGSNTTILNALADSLGYLHADLKKLTYGYYLDLKNICDKQQQEKLELMFRDMFATDIQAGPNGMRGQRRRGRGGRFIN